MKVTVVFKDGEDPTVYSMPEERLRSGLDFAIRHNPEFWEVLRDVAGRYQAELLKAELKRQRLFHNKKES